jgi:opacity protein-like surface antigen
MRNPGNGTATVATLVMLVTVLMSTAAQSRVVLESRGPRHHRSPSPHEFVLEGGLVQPAGDQADDFWTTETGFDAGLGYQLGVRLRQFVGEDFSIAPAFHWTSFGAADGVGEFGVDEFRGYRLETSVIRYGLDLQMYLGEPGAGARPFVTGGLALLHNRYRDEQEGESWYETSVNTPGFSLGGGLRLDNLELSAEYNWNRFTTGNLSSDGQDLDYNWDYLVVRVGVALGR